jgi:tripartite-type tricarboxylate transporter receptor subunit TctC
MKSVPARMNSVTRVLALVAAMLPPAAYAQGAYPTQTVRFIVPFPASTPPDLLARIASQKMAESWSKPPRTAIRFSSPLTSLS